MFGHDSRRHAIRIACALIGVVGCTDVAGSCLTAPYSNVGCDFYAVSLPNALLDKSMFSFGVDLLNSNSTQIDVTISGGALVTPLNFPIAAGANTVLNLPWVASISTAESTVKVAGAAYHIVTSAPITAVQLNPTSALVLATNAYLGDASLLVPGASGGTQYRVLSWPTWGPSGLQYVGYVAVNAMSNSTSVQVAANGTIEPGAGLTANGGTVSLNQGEVLLIASGRNAPVDGFGADLSGMTISSSLPVLVWTGATATQVPLGTLYADYLEEMLPPLPAIGSDYYVVRPTNPNGLPTGAKHYVKLVATTNSTALTFDPPIPGAPASMDAGGVATFEATSDFHLQASQPMLVATVMEGSQAFGATVGDPALSFVVPWNQARRSVDFAAPSSIGPAWAQVVTRTGAAIKIDGTSVDGWASIGSSGYSAANVALCCSDAHRAIGNSAFTLSVYSYPNSSAYWYPAAVGFEEVFADGFE